MASNNSNYYPSGTGQTASQTTARMLALKDENARLQAENERLRAFVEEFSKWNWISTPMPFHHLLDWQDKAAALLASVQAGTTAEDSDE